MGRNHKSFSNENLLPIDVIKAASEGDVEAIDMVLRHYEG